MLDALGGPRSISRTVLIAKLRFPREEEWAALSVLARWPALRVSGSPTAPTIAWALDRSFPCVCMDGSAHQPTWPVALFPWENTDGTPGRSSSHSKHETCTGNDRGDGVQRGGRGRPRGGGCDERGAPLTHVT